MIPSALLLQSEIIGGRTVIGFYAGGITPIDFGEYIARLTGKTFQQIWNLLSGWFKEDPRRKWILVPLSAAFIIPLILYPKQAMAILLIVLMLLASQIPALSVQEGELLPNYFGILKEGLTISVPKG